jgi:hypothetical protein
VGGGGGDGKGRAGEPDGGESSGAGPLNRCESTREGTK